MFMRAMVDEYPSKTPTVPVLQFWFSIRSPEQPARTICPAPEGTEPPVRLVIKTRGFPFTVFELLMVCVDQNSRALPLIMRPFPIMLLLVKEVFSLLWRAIPSRLF